VAILREFLLKMGHDNYRYADKHQSSHPAIDRCKNHFSTKTMGRITIKFPLKILIG